MDTMLLMQTELLNYLIELTEIGVGLIGIGLIYILLRDGVNYFFDLAKKFSKKP